MSGEAPFHAHIYFDAAERAAADELRTRLAALEAVLFAGPLRGEPVGPHPMGQFEIHFHAAALSRVRPVLAESGLRVLIHPVTLDDLADHTTLAEWLGEPLALDASVLDPPGINQGLDRFGKADF